ncbi:hypothetical protein MMC26_002771 [Xylographa opegraphella]|nr:hypothetical protein [Xylographa opegraphella]
MTTNDNYTPLEAFLFFQSLRAHGIQSSSFSRISEALKQNEFIKHNNNERFNPESLKRFYLELLKEEIRGERLQGNNQSSDGNHNPRKRKLSTPPLESIDGTAAHEQLLPQLVNRLYARYRDHAIGIIQEEERKIQILQSDINEIEKGEWDERLQAQEASSRRDSKGVSSIQTLLRHDADDKIQGAALGKDGPEATGLQSGVLHNPDAAGQHEVSGYSRPNHITGDPKSRISDGSVGQPRLPSASGVVPTYSPKPDGYQAVSRPSSQSRMDGHSTYLPPIGGPVLSPTPDTNRRLPHPTPPMVPPLASPGLSNSPIILPPPAGMIRSSASPAGPLDALADMAGQQYRPNPNVQSPRQGQFYSPQSRPNQLPQPRNFIQRSYPYYDSQVAYSQHYPPYGQNPLPPYQSPNQAQYPPPASPAGYWSGPRQNGMPPYQSPLSSYPQFAGYSPGQAGYQQSPQGQPLNSAQTPRLPVNTPLSVASRRQAHQPSPIDTSVSSTKWKRVSLPESGNIPGSPSPLGPEAVSPISEKEGSPVTEGPEQYAVPARHSIRDRASLRVRKPEDDTEPTRGKKFARGPHGGRSRGGNTGERGRRAASIASSTLDVSATTATRSQSLISHADELSHDEPDLGSSRKIKPEPPATPAAAVDDIVSIMSTPTGDLARSSGRKHRDTIRSLEPPQSVRPSGKRKRADTIENTPDLPTPSALSRPNHVLASRNFPRTSAPIMNDIRTHKLASMFAKPLTEREAPGYKDVIYRPQDLKSIKAAIGFASRALAATDDTGSPAIGGTKGSASIWVGKSLDVMPPKGIVNSTQLEKELCRIFANAVMFNPDPKRGLGPAFRTRSRLIAAGKEIGDEDAIVIDEEDGGGVVRDTREMFETVEKSVSNWRAAERAGEDGRARLRGGEETKEESEVDELAGEEGTEEEGPGNAKRRRKG